MKYLIFFLILIGFYTTTPSFAIPDYPLDFAEFIGLKNTYMLGEQFTIKFEKMTRQSCPSYEISLMKNGVPESKITRGVEPMCATTVPVEPYLFSGEYAKPEFFDTAGTYIVTLSMDGRTFSKPIEIIDQTISPLKQIKSGITFDEIQCKDNLVLIQKYDGTPACVKPETKSKLEKRGWAEFDKSKMTELFQSSPEVKEFYAVYDDADVSVKEDHISYFAGSEDDYFARMNIFFDKNHALDHIDFNCYFQKDHQFELAQEDIISKLKKYECKEIPKSEPEPEPMPDVETQLYDARKSLKEAYQNHVNLGQYYMKDVIVGFGINGDTLVVDIPSKYTDQNSIQIIKKEIRHIVGDQVKVDYVVYDESIERHIETVIPYLWNKILHQNKIDFTPKNQTYWNHADGFADHDKVCSPLVAPNGTEFFISSTFDLEPFDITGTYIDKTEPADCHKIWKTEVIVPEPDRVTALWLENEN